MSRLRRSDLCKLNRRGRLKTEGCARQPFDVVVPALQLAAGELLRGLVATLCPQCSRSFATDFCEFAQLAWALPTQNGLNYGADWEPDRPAYDSSAPIYPVDYTDSEQQQQRSAGQLWSTAGYLR